MSDSIETLRAEFERIVAMVEKDSSDQKRHATLRELVALYRRAEQASEEIGVLQAEVREFGTKLRSVDREPAAASPTRRSSPCPAAAGT